MTVEVQTEGALSDSHQKKIINRIPAEIAGEFVDTAFPCGALFGN